MIKKAVVKRIIASLLCLGIIGTLNAPGLLFHTSAQHNLGISLGYSDGGSGSQLENDSLTFTLEPLDDTSVLVYDYEDLKEAITGNNTYINIYFAKDITAPDKDMHFTIPARKDGLVISGSPPNSDTIHTFTQRNTTVAANAFLVSDAGVTSVTIEDMTVQGYNHWGIVPVSASGVTVTHRNVTYTGPQISYNVQGTTEFIDCTINLVEQGSPVGEVAEANKIVLGGETTITRNTVSTAHATF